MPSDVVFSGLLRTIVSGNVVFESLTVFFAAYLPYVTILAAVFLLFRETLWRRRLYNILLVGLSGILAYGVVTPIFRFFLPRPRPFVALDFTPLVAVDITPSFPSGHAIFFFAIATAFYFLRPRAGFWFLIVAGIISVARVAAGIHWTFDIIGGALLGILCGYAAKLILPHLNFPKSES